MRVHVATQNPGKIEDLKALRALIPGLEWQFHKDIDYPEETGTTFEANAAIKARALYKHLDQKESVLADDSGLVIPALNNEPGVFSARYAGAQATNQENCDKVIGRLQKLNLVETDAYFVCCLAFIRPDTPITYVTGKCHGRIGVEMKGSNGFGYDPLFIPNGYERTFGQMQSYEKAALSHRRKALDLWVSAAKELM